MIKFHYVYQKKGCLHYFAHVHLKFKTWKYINSRNWNVSINFRNKILKDYTDNNLVRTPIKSIYILNLL